MAFISITALGFSQDIDVKGQDLGPTVDPNYPDIDYIKIHEPPGNNRVPQPCTRLQGTGLPQYEVQFKAYGWSNGPNGIPEYGGGGDVRKGQVRAMWSTEVPASLGTINSLNGLFTAAIDIDCDDGRVFANYRYYKEGQGFVILSDVSSIAVIPPDWIPTAPMQDLSKVGSDKE
jgi:hypothetical protein